MRLRAFLGAQTRVPRRNSMEGTMSIEFKVILATAITAFAYFIWCLCRVSARAERAARQRRHDLNQSVIARRLR